MSESVKIERMSYGVCAVGRLASGKTVFVPGGTPGETVEVDVIEDKPRFARAMIAGGTAHTSGETGASGVRDAFDATAPWAHLPYELQLAQKQAIVRDALVRVGHFSDEEADALVRPIVRSKDAWGYRNKLELAATTDERGRFALGFHGADSARIAAVERCALGNRLIERAPAALAGALRYLAGGDDLGIYRVGIRGSLGTKSVEVALWTPPSAFPRTFAAKMLVDAVGAESVVRVIAEPGKARKVKRVEVLAGEGHWREQMVGVGPQVSRAGRAADHVAGHADYADRTDHADRADRASAASPQRPLSYAVSAPSFFQVNTKQATKLVSHALEALAVEAGQAIVDLYAGVGTFSIPLARAGARVAAIELEGSAARDLRRNCAKNGVDIDVVCDDAGRALPQVARRLGRLDAIVVDPPRSGLDKRAISHIAQASPQRIAYVSCDPQTMARDAARLRERGWHLASTTPVDLFPQTYHVETVNLFERP